LKFSSISHVGLVKKINQDKIQAKQTKDGYIFIVCDGLSGLSKGEIASEICTETVISNFSNIGYDPKSIIKKSLLNAHKNIIEASNTKMGSTVALVYIEKNEVYAAWCGDSRIYHIRNKEIKWMSRDHTILHDVLNRGYVKGDLIYNLNAITRFIGNTQNHDSEISNFSSKKGDVILICSDGLHNFIMEPKIIDSVCNNSPQAASDIMKNELLNKKINAPDNFSWYIINI
jgi:protein phosphatase